MFLTLQVVTVFLVAITMGLALAHALELPGKLRLDQQTYLATQTIYYPGFTIGGIAEPLAVVALILLLVATGRDNTKFWWILAGLIAVVAMQGVFWFVTQPANRFWLKHQHLNQAGSRFFSIDQSREHRSGDQDWRQLRNQWEYSHVARAALATIALIALATAIAL